MKHLADRVDVDYESWMDSGRIHDPEELAARLNERRASILVVELDFVFEEMFEAVPDLEFVGVCRAATNQVDMWRRPRPTALRS